MAVEVFMPKMSDHMEFGAIVEWIAKEGDRVEEGQPIVEVMTDKTTTEIEAPATGILKGIREGAVKDAEIPVGETFAFIAQEGEEITALPPLEIGKKSDKGDKAPKESKAEDSGREDVTPSQESEKTATQSSGGVRATPAARRRAKELGIDISRVHGTGPNGMVSDKDVDNYAKS
ncbi:MAG: E3 binding domain-containing protein [Spirochaetota bacterium]|nr:MAG: E3 binding domain-containing protein [Spirochaetota bacterium]